MMQSITDKEIVFHVFFDRASDTDARFIPVAQWACHHVIHHINFHKLAYRAWDKVAMHQLISASMDTPFTLTLPSYDEQPLLSEIDLSSLGERFTIKPAYGGGGDGVINEATTLSQVLIARKEFPNQKYLLQGYIMPTRLGSRMAWFRVIYCAGKVYPCWWDNDTHIYTQVTPDEEACYNLSSLRSIASSIANLCGLTLFSTEIAVTPDGRFVIVDYVNDPIDLRLQSKAFDGVPDAIVKDITERLVELILSRHTPSQD
jgi:glutathione synthase/RimK-type ligase-like ATP-grasp enzyme